MGVIVHVFVKCMCVHVYARTHTHHLQNVGEDALVVLERVVGEDVPDDYRVRYDQERLGHQTHLENAAVLEVVVQQLLQVVLGAVCNRLREEGQVGDFGVVGVDEPGRNSRRSKPQYIGRSRATS